MQHHSHIHAPRLLLPHGLSTLSLLFSLFLLSAFPVATVAQTGKWKNYLSYYEPTEIEKASENQLYVLASGGLYAYNRSDQSLQTFDKTTGLNDSGISHIAWCQAARRLVIVYDNYNIDLLSPQGTVTNMADYMSKSLAVDKTVNSIDVTGTTAYLSTGFGILKLNVAQAEISDTYQLGFTVDYSYVEGNFLYAASHTNGLYRGLLTSNLLDKTNWTRVGDFTARPKTMDADLLALVKTLSPGGPKYNYFGFSRFYDGKLYTVGGGYPPDDDLFRPGCVQVLDGDKWTIYEDGLEAKTGHAYLDMGSVDVDPRDANHVFASGRTGLYEFRNGAFVGEYTPDNSPLRGAATVSATNKEYNIVQGIKFDAGANLWVLNSLSATTSLLKYSHDGQWENLHKPELMHNGYSLGRLNTPIIDSRGLLWIPNNHSGAPQAICYQPGNDALKCLTSFVNEDGTTVNVSYVRCIAEDREGNIWVCTNVGPLLLPPNQITAASPVFTQVKVPRNDGTNYADYLLDKVDISCMVVDQANRKWFGTNSNGVYLISSNNLMQIQHFTRENSMLLSNNIESIALNETTGEVYIGTGKGLCSYMSNAPTAANGMTKASVYAYPNPVRPDYMGAITITGLDERADVKIVNSNGTLVYEGRASGGQCRWYGLDRDGRRVASGVYMVEVATAEGEKGVVCKIAIVR